MSCATKRGKSRMGLTHDTPKVVKRDESTGLLLKFVCLLFCLAACHRSTQFCERDRGLVCERKLDPHDFQTAPLLISLKIELPQTESYHSVRQSPRSVKLSTSCNTPE